LHEEEAMSDSLVWTVTVVPPVPSSDYTITETNVRFDYIDGLQPTRYRDLKPNPSGERRSYRSDEEYVKRASGSVLLRGPAGTTSTHILETQESTPHYYSARTLVYRVDPNKPIIKPDPPTSAPTNLIAESAAEPAGRPIPVVYVEPGSLVVKRGKNRTLTISIKGAAARGPFALEFNYGDLPRGVTLEPREPKIKEGVYSTRVKLRVANSARPMKSEKTVRITLISLANSPPQGRVHSMFRLIVV
jgi:hypothetical protein